MQSIHEEASIRSTSTQSNDLYTAGGANVYEISGIKCGQVVNFYIHVINEQTD